MLLARSDPNSLHKEKNNFYWILYFGISFMFVVSISITFLTMFIGETNLFYFCQDYFVKDCLSNFEFFICLTIYGSFNLFFIYLIYRLIISIIQCISQGTKEFNEKELKYNDQKFDSRRHSSIIETTNLNFTWAIKLIKPVINC